jgi:hypothetical protein
MLHYYDKGFLLRKKFSEGNSYLIFFGDDKDFLQLTFLSKRHPQVAQILFENRVALRSRFMQYYNYETEFS